MGNAMVFIVFYKKLPKKKRKTQDIHTGCVMCMFWPTFKVYRLEKWAKTYDALCRIFRICQHISSKTFKNYFVKCFSMLVYAPNMTVSDESLIVHGI